MRRSERISPATGTSSILTVIGLLLAAQSAPAAGGVHGHARFEKVKGNPVLGYQELYETNLFLSPADDSLVGPSRRLGTTVYNGGCQTVTTHDGAFCIDSLPAAGYSILVNQPLFYVAPRVVPYVVVPEGAFIELNIDLGIDYSTYFKSDWTGPENRWYQTFVATGTGIRGVEFSYAGNSPASVSVALMRDNGDPDVRNWPVVVERVDPDVGAVTDNWVRFRSQEAPTDAGQTYAIRLTANGGSGVIQPYKRNKDPNSYVGGRAYNSAGTPQNFDINLVVFSDNDGTVVTMNKRTQGLGQLLEGNFSVKWGQTFTATQASLAAVDVWASGANHIWDLTFTWRIREGGPGGPQISPTKKTAAAYQSFGSGLHGVSYDPNEVRLTAGQTYFVEFETVNPPMGSQGFNPYIMDTDSYDGGTGWFWNGAEWIQRPTQDVSMTILEYRPIGPRIQLNPTAIVRKLHRGGSLPPENFTVTNIGNDLLVYTIADDAAWLEVDPTAGDSAGEPDLITLTYDVASLGVGTYPATVTVTAPGATNSPTGLAVQVMVQTVPPDFDRDEDVDIRDFGFLQACYSGQGIPQNDAACADARLDGDGDVDPDDLQIFLRCFSGPNVLPAHDCAPVR